MSRRKSTTQAPGAGESASFEDAFAMLESIVEAMEHEKLPLEDLVSHYERGSHLLSRCEQILHAAKNRIELITLRNQNEISLDSPASVADTPPGLAHGTMEDPDEDDDDIRLF